MASLQQQFVPRTIHIVEPAASYAQQLTALFRNSGYECRVYISGASFLAHADCTLPGCSVISQVLPDMLGLELFRQLRSLHPNAQAVLLSESWFLSDVVQAMKQGAIEVLEKNVSRLRLMAAVEEAMRTDNELIARKKRAVPEAILQKLTSEEGRIFQLLMQGLTAKQVGAELDMSVRTIHYRKKELLRKLGVSGRSEAIELCRTQNAQDLPM